MPARSALRLNLAFVGAIALVIAIANPAAAPPGDLDPTFHGDGRVTTDFGGNNDGAHGLAIQGNGKIVAAGWATPASEDFGLARYNTDGSLDNTFDGDGLLTTDFITDGTGDRARAVAIQADG
jgi:uncharacterized delta-60 repeat protein